MDQSTLQPPLLVSDICKTSCGRGARIRDQRGACGAKYTRGLGCILGERCGGACDDACGEGGGRARAHSLCTRSSARRTTAFIVAP
jgi:hypothetical protein